MHAYKIRSFAISSLLITALTLCVLVCPVQATEIPWESRVNIATSFDGVADIDIADIDVLATAVNHDDIVWWENTNASGDGTAWSSHNVISGYTDVESIYAADIDDNGDPDVLGASSTCNDIRLWKNTDGNGIGRQEYSVDDDLSRTSSICADDVLKITMTHLGRPGDSSEEFATLELRFEGCYGDGCTLVSLASAQAHELFDALYIYRDDGDGRFDSGSDALVDATLTTFSLVDGVQTVTFHDGGGNLRVDFGASETYFVVLDRVASPPADLTVSRFRVTHLTEAGSTAEDRSSDIPLIMEYAPNTATGTLVIPLPPQAVDDAGAGFETDEDTAFTTANVLANDSNPNGGSLLVTGFDATGTLGQVGDYGDGTFDYDPGGQFESLAPGESATDVFTYTISDGYGGTDAATVRLTIFGVNNDPNAADDSGIGFSTDKNTAFTTANVLSNDSDPEKGVLAVKSIDTSGTLGRVSDNGDGTFDYDPNGQFESLALGERATDTFTYTLGDGFGGSDVAMVTITITGVQDDFFIYLPLVVR